MLQGGGFEIIDLGTDLPAERFIAAIIQHDVRLIGMSALLTTTMPCMANVIQVVKEAGLADVKVMVGGAPLTQRFAKSLPPQYNMKIRLSMPDFHGTLVREE